MHRPNSFGQVGTGLWGPKFPKALSASALLTLSCMVQVSLSSRHSKAACRRLFSPLHISYVETQSVACRGVQASLNPLHISRKPLSQWRADVCLPRCRFHSYWPTQWSTNDRVIKQDHTERNRARRCFEIYFYIHISKHLSLKLK
jgi:hypothetical protein